MSSLGDRVPAIRRPRSICSRGHHHSHYGANDTDPSRYSKITTVLNEIPIDVGGDTSPYHFPSIKQSSHCGHRPRIENRGEDQQPSANHPGRSTHAEASQELVKGIFNIV
ncbi:hypothetical protein HQO83_06685 [Rhodococcus fascians]|nr:hypothetical protein [Rhodococcus fascians]